MTITIHPTAIIDSRAQIGEGCVIGPYCIIGSDVTLGEGCELVSHISIQGKTTLGAHNKIYPFACLGFEPLFKGDPGPDSRLEIGSHNIIREHATMHPGTYLGDGVTRIGDHGYFMIGIHVAHDCRVGNHVVMANNATLGGFVEVGNYVNIGGLAAIHQKVVIGDFAMIGGTAGVRHNIIPYGMVKGKEGNLIGLNIVGLKRQGATNNDVRALSKAYEAIFFPKEGSETLQDRVRRVAAEVQGNAQIDRMVNFILEGQKGHIRVPQEALNT